jgi:hypothetical protein
VNLSFHPLRFAFCIALLALAGETTSLHAADPSHETAISRVASMPNLPAPFVMRDWHQVTHDYLNLVFDDQQQGDHLPLVRWLDDQHTQFTIPAYVGGKREPEAINFLAAIVSGGLVGIDMRNFRGQDWVARGNNFYNDSEGVYINRLGHHSGKSFWYDIFPNVLFFQVNALYPDDPVREAQSRSVAAKWHDACVALGAKSDPPALPNFDHTGLALATMQPVETGWIEPEAAAGIAWLEYMAWVKHQDPRFLTAADWAIRSLETRPPDESPLYEVLLPYGALAAARMNAELGKNYDVAKLVNQCFDPHARPQARPGWGVISDRWQDQDAHGLIGSTTDGEGYAFAMNTYQWAGALAPLARYDTRYARDIGKWILNLANASRLFYPNAHDEAHQSSFAWSKAHDPKSAIAYEGIRKWKRDAAVAVADHSTSHGSIVQGSFEATHARNEAPIDQQVLEEESGSDAPFEHVWEFDLPHAPKRWLVVAAERVDGGHVGNAFEFSYASTPDGPFTKAFQVTGVDAPQVVEIPQGLAGKLYVKAASTDRAAAWSGADQLVVDAMAISSRSEIGPYAQGDQRVTFVALLDEATSPIVLYRPESATTDLGLYGSSHVGILGGIIKPTNVESILQLDLLKTDYFHAAAFPTFLYYNPHAATKTVHIEVGPEATDVYDAVANEFLARGVRGRAEIAIPADSAIVAVLAPAGQEPRRDGKRTLLGDVAVSFTHQE